MEYSPCRFGAYGSRNELSSLCQRTPDLMHMVRAARRPVVSDRTGSIAPSAVMRRRSRSLARCTTTSPTTLFRCHDCASPSAGKRVFISSILIVRGGPVSEPAADPARLHGCGTRSRRLVRDEAGILIPSHRSARQRGRWRSVSRTTRRLRPSLPGRHKHGQSCNADS